MKETLMRKLHVFLAMFLISTILLPACTPATLDCSSKEVFCVGLVTDIGKINDKSFNQSAWEGVQQAQKELGAQVEYIETSNSKDYDTIIAARGHAGYAEL